MTEDRVFENDVAQTQDTRRTQRNTTKLKETKLKANRKRNSTLATKVP